MSLNSVISSENEAEPCRARLSRLTTRPHRARPAKVFALLSSVPHCPPHLRVPLPMDTPSQEGQSECATFQKDFVSFRWRATWT